MTDDDFIRAFESCELPGTEFRHRQHLRLAWLYLRRMPYQDATAAMERGVRRFAAHHGATQKYHHTMTLVWMRLVAAATAAHASEDFEGLLRVHPALLDKLTPQRFYSAARLQGAAARANWLEPDLRPLPPI
jgi:N-formylglutamate deformylase